EDLPIENKIVSKSIESAQKQVEAQNFEVRKNLLKYDDVMNTQREVIYDERQKLIENKDFVQTAKEWIEDTVIAAVNRFTDPKIFPEEWDIEGLIAYVSQIFPVEIGNDIDIGEMSQELLIDELLEKAERIYLQRESELGPEVMRELERRVMLEVIDNRWREHLYELDYLKEGIGLRGIAGHDPLIEYQNEAFDMFHAMIESAKEDFARYIYHAQTVEVERERAPMKVIEGRGGPDGNRQEIRQSDKVGRNDPCPCGSGKKYKKCCGLGD
ncbi:MAG: SEC-C domain-containing protein, partial [Actinobacteria bacterium]|nr:SEC-C domain-containing protein [Actinomycetota bacterium]